VVLTRSWVYKALMLFTLRTNRSHFTSAGSLACIITLLLGPIQYYYPYNNNLSFYSEAYGQRQTVEVDDGQINIADGQRQTVEVDDGQINIADGQRQTNEEDDDRGDVPSEDANLDEDIPPPPQVQSQSPSVAQTGVVGTEENTSHQANGPIKFAFVDSFWTDYTSLGGVIASTSAESVTAQPLAPVTRQEVEPGQGEAILAVVLRNVGFADATSISGSLDLPSGFKAIITPENVDSDTTLASYNGIVKAGQTFTLYFRILVTAETQVGKEYAGDLKIRYFRVDEQEEEDTRSTTLEIPFRLSGKVTLSTSAIVTFSDSSNTQGAQASLSNIVTANPGVANPLRIQISNNGSSIATGVVVDVLPPGTVSSSTDQSGVDGSGTIVNNSAESATSAPSQQVLSSSPTSATMVIVGSPTFNVGIIGAKEKREIVPTIFPADTAAGTLTTLNIQISYNDAYGNRRTLNQVLGIQISPESPQSGLNVLPSSFSSWERMPGRSLPLVTPISFGTPLNNNTIVTQDDMVSSTISNSANLSSNRPESIRIIAGSVEEISFVVANDNNQGVTISDVVVSLSSESNALRILGDSRWDLRSIGPGSQQELSTQVYASTSLIGSPIFFTVTMQYIRNGNELRTESFQLGAIVVGNIQISVNDVAISYIGDTPNLVGNLLNEGNTPALFTKIELYPSGTQGALQMLQPTVTSQFLGDVAVNSPLAFNIPLQITEQELGQEAMSIDYPISLKITYSNELRNTHEIIVNKTISLEPVQVRTRQQQPDVSSQQNVLLNNGFIDAYWVDNSEVLSSANTGNSSIAAGTTDSTLSSEREVGPGEGPSVLAVVLSNTAFSDITGIIGYLTLPDGFAATSTTASLPSPPSSSSSSTSNDNSSEKTPSQTSIASLSGIVRAGQTYTLYFKVNVLESAQKGFHESILRINYFKVPEPQPGTYRIQTVTVPFELPGRVILDVASETEDLVPGEANEVILTIRNTGSADARGVVVNINAIGGSIITNSPQATEITRDNNGSNNVVSSDSQSEEQQQPSSSTSAIASLGTRTFNIGTITANGSSEIATTVYPSSSAGGTLQNLDIEITYNNANGDRRSTPISIGFRVLPNPPEGGLSVTPSSSSETLGGQERVILATTIAGSPDGNTTPNGNDASEVTIIAGRAHDMNFNITNNNRNSITDIVVTLASRSDSLEITGDSRWTLQELGPQSMARFSTRVFASDTLIGSPVSFEVGIQYISGDQIKSDSFSLGGNVIGEIKIGINELAIRNIGDVPNLTGNLLNQGNTNALFTTIELVTSPAGINQSVIVPVTNTPQYLGDLQDNSPLPFSIPLAIDNSDGGSTIATGNYPISLSITYSDELRNTHQVILNSTVSYSPPQQQEEAPDQGFLGFSSATTNDNNTSGSVALLPLILIVIAIAALAIVLVRRRRSRRKKISRFMSGRDDNDDFDQALDENPGHSQNNESSHEK
jgi:hypothetical protein